MCIRHEGQEDGDMATYTKDERVRLGTHPIKIFLEGENKQHRDGIRHGGRGGDMYIYKDREYRKECTLLRFFLEGEQIMHRDGIRHGGRRRCSVHISRIQRVS
ncbi:hypothetical protein AVEN_218240-1 [Araneus ventricosus]|uniref:Uncharacterized protein n=1 Tax=Araneus ventricosus TaxID=182803 RepID=A0A4Y2LK20_ARAVE|nr:hypothetical protein AVEN_218240-1 [Araneus ventricosus]